MRTAVIAAVLGTACAAPGAALFNGRDFAGWRIEPGHEGHWIVRDGVIAYDGGATAADPTLWTASEYGDFTLTVDWRLPRAPVETDRPVIGPDGRETGEVVRVADAGDSGIYLRGNSKSQVNIWCWPVGSGEVWGYRTDSAVTDEVRAATTPRARADRPPGEWNRFVITMRGDRLTVRLNDALVIDGAPLPGVPERGAIGLQHHGDPVEFRNIRIREDP